jgi:2-polyprenyl-3-methyl-5-hydroxy-6-metoxy-1,4-benzoquinol methylase
VKRRATAAEGRVPPFSPQPWPAGGLEEVKECPVCRGDRRTSVHRDLTDGVFFCAPGLWNMYRCDRCGTCYLDPRPTASTIHLAYEKYFTHEQAGDPAQDAALTGMRRLRRSLANGYRNWRYGTEARPASRLGIWVALLLPRLRHAADAGMRFVPRAAEGRRLLDVGAGNGAFLLQARSAGWEVLGVEPDPAAVEAARRAGLDVRIGGIECLSGARLSVDVITMNHVIEHVHDPRTVLREAFDLLRPGGTVFIETPNAASLGHERFGRHWRGLEPPRHLVLFNWSSLERLLTDVGFRHIRRIRRSGVYSTLAAKSRAIEQGRDPEAVQPRPGLPSVAGMVGEIRTLLDYRCAEFITLMAVKR